MPKTILITGASDGIGYEIARQALAKGYEVTMLSRDETRLREAVESLPPGPRPRFAAIDLTDSSQRRNYMIGMEEADFTPDVLVNNAGIGVAGTFADAPWDKLDKLLKLNIVATAHLTHWMFNRMKARGHGSIVNMSSALASRPAPWFAAYSASKGFVSDLSQALFVEGKPFGVTVSVVHPPEIKMTRQVSRQKPDISNTLALHMLPSLPAATVAHAVLRAAEKKQRSSAPGFMTWLAMASAGKVPAWLDLYLMTVLFKRRSWLEPKTADVPPFIQKSK